MAIKKKLPKSAPKSAPKTRKKKRKYSDAEKATILAAVDANGGNVKNTTDQLGIPNTTVEDWTNGRNIHPSLTELRKLKKDDLASAIEDVAWKIVSALPGKVPDAPLLQASTAFGIAVDKMRLLREQPTSIAGKQDISEDEFNRRLQALADRLRSRANGSGDASGIRAIESIPSGPTDLESLPK